MFPGLRGQATFDAKVNFNFEKQRVSYYARNIMVSMFARQGNNFGNTVKASIFTRLPWPLDINAVLCH